MTQVCFNNICNSCIFDDPVKSHPYEAFSPAQYRIPYSWNLDKNDCFSFLYKLHITNISNYPIKFGIIRFIWEYNSIGLDKAGVPDNRTTWRACETTHCAALNLAVLMLFRAWDSSYT